MSRKTNITIIILSKHNIHSHAVDDIVLPLAYALNRIGYTVDIRKNGFAKKSINIIFGLQDIQTIDFSKIPENSIIYNTEQITPNSKALRLHYMKALKRFAVWEYSLRNYTILKNSFNLQNIQHVPLGYVPEMTRLDSSYPKDIDILLYGALNERRTRIVEKLRSEGARAFGVSGVYGAERDYLIAKSKVILNVHHYIPAVLEIVRLGYLFANKKTIVSECNDNTEVHDGYEESCIFAPYENLAEKALEALRAPKACDLAAEQGFKIFSSHPYEDILSAALAKAGIRPGKKTAPLPRMLNAGSGKDFRREELNVDINPNWNPDIVLDLSQPVDRAVKHESRRFGTFFFSDGMFEQIRAFDMIEHVADVPRTMKNFLDLLCEGGVLLLNVPYDLSLGAWQDPTHRHAFNENSWLYYTKWSWYLGWREYRFDLQELKYVPSVLGKQLTDEGKSQEEILRVPRAVDFMTARLVKRKAAPSEIMECDMRRRAFYKGALGEWTV